MRWPPASGPGRAGRLNVLPLRPFPWSQMTAALLRMVHLMLKSRTELANALHPIIISDGLCWGARPPVGDSRSSRRGCSRSVVLSSIWYRRSKHGRCSAALRPGCGASGPCATATQVKGRKSRAGRTRGFVQILRRWSGPPPRLGRCSSSCRPGPRRRPAMGSSRAPSRRGRMPRPAPGGKRTVAQNSCH